MTENSCKDFPIEVSPQIPRLGLRSKKPVGNLLGIDRQNDSIRSLHEHVGGGLQPNAGQSRSLNLCYDNRLVVRVDAFCNHFAELLASGAEDGKRLRASDEQVAGKDRGVVGVDPVQIVAIGTTQSTGPKISSRAIRIWLVT